MLKSTERNLSLIIAITALAVFALTLAGVFLNNSLIGLLWNGLFIISWLMMFVFGMVVLFDKTAFHFSIFVGFVTALAFMALSAHAILILARFIPQIPARIILPNTSLLKYNQMIFYTALIIVYFIHIINYIKLNPHRKLEEKIETIESKEEEILPTTDEEKLSEEELDQEPSKEDLLILNSHLAQDNDLLLEIDQDDQKDLTNKKGLEE